MAAVCIADARGEEAFFVARIISDSNHGRSFDADYVNTPDAGPVYLSRRLILNGRGLAS
jgi:hypothetical protein